MGISYTFKRYEKKYLLNGEQYAALRKRLEGKAQTDSYGLTAICNIYYDTEDFYLIRESLEKPAYKEKFRVRSYGIPDESSNIFLEIKKKYDGVVYKRRTSLPYGEAVNYLEKGIRPENETQIFKEIDWFLNFYNAKPKVYLAYDRIAMYGAMDNELRITFDTAIRSRFYDLDLAKGDYGRRLLPEETYLMEIKAAGAMPLWLARALSDLEIMPVSFSKYGNVYKQKMADDKRIEFTENKIKSAV